MKKIRRTGIFIVILFVFANISLISSCGGKAEDVIIIAGSTSVSPYAEMLAQKFEEKNSKTEIDVQGGGSSAGFQAVLSGAAHIGMSSRSIKDDEWNAVNDIGKTFYIEEIAKDGLAIIVHPDNPVRNLTLEQVRDIYSGKYKNWKDIEGAGGNDEEIFVITREEGSGTRDAFVSLVMGKEPITPKAIVQDSNGAVRLLVSDYRKYIGFISLGLVESEESKKQVNPEDKPDPEVIALHLNGIEASVENVKTDDYKLFRPFLFIVVVDMDENGNPKDPDDGLTKEFIEFVMSPEGQKIMEDEGLIPSMVGCG